MTTYVVPLDGSPFAERALPVASALAARRDGAVLLVATRWRHDDLDSDSYLEQIAARAAVPTEHVTIQDRGAADAIALVARSEPDRRVCMTTHGRGGLRWAVLGSVAEAVVHDSGAPVVLVGPHCWQQWPEQARRVILCIDGSRLPPDLVPAACHYARDLNLPIAVVHIAHPLDVETATHPAALLDPVVEQVRAEGVEAVGELYRSSYATGAIADAAQATGAVLVAMSTHGRTGLARVAVGSVTMGVLNTASCPVLVVRSPHVR